MNKLGFETTAAEVVEGIDLKGKVILLTGGSGGLGKETARALARRGATLTIVTMAAEEEQLLQAAEQIENETGNKVETGIVDLDKPETVQRFTEEWMKKHEKLDILINNAGIMAQNLIRVRDGWEIQLAVNYLGHFQLTNLLLPALKASGDARVVNVASNGHIVSAPNLDDLNFENGDFDPIKAYGSAKSSVIWFSNEFDRKYKNDNIRSFAVHPGGIPTTGLAKNMEAEAREAAIEQSRQLGIIKTIEQGAATACWAASSSELEGKGGLYLADCNIASPSKDLTDPTDSGYAPHAFNEEGEKKLWMLTNELLGTDF